MSKDPQWTVAHGVAASLKSDGSSDDDGLALPAHVDKAQAGGGGDLADTVVIVTAIAHGLLQAGDDIGHQGGALGLGQLRGIAQAGLAAANDLLVPPIPGEVTFGLIRLRRFILSD